MTRKFSVSILFAICCSVAAVGQHNGQFDFKQSFGVTVTYSPNSSHILIGNAEGREITTAGFEYTHRLFEVPAMRLDYSGEISPLYRESDPAESGIEETYNGVTTTLMFSNLSRIVHSHAGFEGNDCVTHYPTCVPIYGIQGPNEITYGFATAPFGVRAIFLPKHRIQPTFTANVGFIVTQRAIPVDGAALMNYQFSIGPGVQVFTSEKSSFRAEYLYRHISNGNANLNPGIDQGVFRITYSLHR